MRVYSKINLSAMKWRSFYPSGYNSRLTPSLSNSASWSETRNSNSVSPPNKQPRNAPSGFKAFWIWNIIPTIQNYNRSNQLIMLIFYNMLFLCYLGQIRLFVHIEMSVLHELTDYCTLKICFHFLVIMHSI